MKFKVVVTVGTIDRYGFLGRELHPEPTDAGMCGVLVSTEQVWNGTTDDDFIQMSRVQLADGRTVDLVESEIVNVQVEVER